MSSDSHPPNPLPASPKQTEKIRVLIVDDHAVVRQGLRTFLDLQDDAASLPIAVVGEASNGSQAVDQARLLQPDVVLLDLVMPEMDGVEATSRIIESSPHSRVVILTSFGEEDKVIPAIRAGAQGYLLKDIAPNDLVHAVREAYRGQGFNEFMAASCADAKIVAQQTANFNRDEGLTVFENILQAQPEITASLPITTRSSWAWPAGCCWPRMMHRQPWSSSPGCMPPWGAQQVHRLPIG